MEPFEIAIIIFGVIISIGGFKVVHLINKRRNEFHEEKIRYDTTYTGRVKDLPPYFKEHIRNALNNDEEMAELAENAPLSIEDKHSNFKLGIQDKYEIEIFKNILNKEKYYGYL